MERISQRFWAGGGIAAPLAAEQGIAVTPRPRYGPLCTVYSRIASQSSAQPQRRLRIPAEAARTRSFSTDAVVGRCRFSATLFRSILDPLGRPTFFFPPLSSSSSYSASFPSICPPFSESLIEGLWGDFRWWLDEFCDRGIYWTFCFLFKVEDKERWMVSILEILFNSLIQQWQKSRVEKVIT